jgi:hypothetical protein
VKFGTPVLFEVALLNYHEMFTWFVQKDAGLQATGADGQGILAYLRDYRSVKMAEFVQGLISQHDELG